jgi:hypothetical protein
MTRGTPHEVTAMPTRCACRLGSTLAVGTSKVGFPMNAIVRYAALMFGGWLFHKVVRRVEGRRIQEERQRLGMRPSSQPLSDEWRRELSRKS